MQTFLRFSFVLAASAVSACSTQRVEASTLPPVPAPAPESQQYREPQIDLWLSGGSIVRRNDPLRASYRSTDDGYVTIARIDTDGRISVLFPRTPYDDNWVEGGRTYRLYGHDDASFYADNYPGLGYVFAIVSSQRLQMRRYAQASAWDYDALGRTVHGDPYMAMRHFAEQMLYDANDPYSLDYETYSVEQAYAYPRFLCYDCHHGRPYPVWNPYDHACVHYRVVIYDDPDYYPYRNGGRRVVYSRPRYEFKPVRAGEPTPTVATAIEYRRRNVAVDNRRPGSPAQDPNLPSPNGGGRGGSSAGGTRPGDDIGNQGADDPRRPGNRRGQEADGPGNSNNAPGHGNRPERVSPPGQENGNNGNGNGNGNGNANGQGDANGQGNANGQGSNHAGHPDNGQGNGGVNNGNGNGNGVGNGNGGSNTNGNGGTQGNSGNSGNGRRPSYEAPVTGGSSTADAPSGTDRRPERRAEPSREQPQAERPREEPRTERPREESRPQPQPQQQPRSEPHSEPRAEPRSEPRREAEPQRRSEPKSEPSRPSAPVKSRPRSP